MAGKRIVRQFVVRAVLIKDRSVLLVNKIGEPHLFLPGGRVEPGESIRYALKRELREELGKDCTIGTYVGAIEHSFLYGENDHFYEIGHFFLVEIPDLPTKIVSAEKELKFMWAKIDDLGKIDIRPKPVVTLVKMVAKGMTTPFWATTME